MFLIFIISSLNATVKQEISLLVKRLTLTYLLVVFVVEEVPLPVLSLGIGYIVAHLNRSNVYGHCEQFILGTFS